MNNRNNFIAPLDIMTGILSYLSIANYDENQKQNKKLDTIIFDMEEKLEYQNKLLNKILKELEGLNSGNKTLP